MRNTKIQLHAEKFNKTTVIKAAIALIIMIVVMIVCAVSVWFSGEKAAYNAALGAYESWINDLSAEITSPEGAEPPEIGDSLDFGQAQSLVGDKRGGFEGVVVVGTTGRIIYTTDGDLIAAESYVGDFGAKLPESGAAVSAVRIKGGDYAFALTPLGEKYYIGGFIDFSASVSAFSSFKSTATTMFVVSILVVVAAFVAFVVLTGVNERGHRYEYRIITDAEGRILKSNENFKRDFPQTLRFYDNIARFDENSLNALKLTAFDEEKFIACTAKKFGNGKIKLTASGLTMPYQSQATKPRDLMREAYVSLLPHGKPFLIGNIFLANLQNIKDMFGRDFAENVHDILYGKIAERFVFIYDIDQNHIGVLYPDGKDYEIILQDLRDLVESYNESLKIDNNVVTISVKCGFAICDNSMQQRSFDYAMTAAEAALKRAREDKLKNYYVFHSSEIKNYEKYFVNYDIRQMLEDNMFEMEYQPQYGIKENRIVGFEALFRVKKSAHMQVNIFELIQYAERSGNMVLLGDFIFDTAMAFAKRVEDKGVTVSVNVSPIQLMQAGFCENFLEIYNRHEIKPGVICVEITESFLVQNFDDAVQKLDILREHGIEIHLDDFGTRYSSMLYLKKLPCSVIKIDREFVINVDKDGIDRAIIDMIIQICKTQGFQSISEGVETKEQFDNLKNMGVDIIQGYLIGRSVPSATAIKMIDEFRL